MIMELDTMNSIEIIQRISAIANNYNCRAVLIDFDNFLVNIEGTESQRAACVIDIKNQLGQYLAQPRITTLYGWPRCGI